MRRCQARHALAGLGGAAVEGPAQHDMSGGERQEESPLDVEAFVQAETSLRRRAVRAMQAAITAGCADLDDVAAVGVAAIEDHSYSVEDFFREKAARYRENQMEVDQNDEAPVEALLPPPEGMSTPKKKKWAPRTRSEFEEVGKALTEAFIENLTPMKKGQRRSDLRPLLLSTARRLQGAKQINIKTSHIQLYVN